MSSIKSVSPDRIHSKKEWLGLRRKELARIIESLWPERHDRIPAASHHFLGEFDEAIDLIKKRKKRFIKRQPKRKAGGQPLWGETDYRGLIAIEAELTKTMMPKDRVQELTRIFNLGEKEIKKRLKEARRILEP